MNMWIAVALSFMWCLGWIVTIFSTSVSQEPFGFKKIGGIVLLFFIWWYVMIAMSNQGDI